MFQNVSLQHNIQKMLVLRILIYLFIFVVSHARHVSKTSDICKTLLSEDLVNEIASYENVKEEILKYVKEGDFKHKTYDE